MEIKVTVTLEERCEVQNVRVHIPESEVEHIVNRVIDAIRSRIRLGAASVT